MVYLDNAATTRKKPEEVYRQFEYYIREIGVSPGRGSYQLGIEASRMLHKARKRVGEYFGLENKLNVVFTKNSTEAINLFLNGFLKAGDHVLLTCYEHNAVLRPLHKMKELGIIDYTVIIRDDLELDVNEIINKYVKSNTVLFVTTLASNLTGRVVFDPVLVRKMKEQGVTVFMDSSQGAGKYTVDMSRQGIDYLAFTGHKDLLAFPGVGGLCCSEKSQIKPLIQGGTGISGDTYVNPDIFPEGLEAGTLNMPAIWSLYTSLGFLMDNFEEISQQEILRKYLVQELSKLNNVEIYDKNKKGISVVGFNVKGIASSKVVRMLDEKNICVRGGIHCAILAHQALKTVQTGVVRASIGFGNTQADIDALLTAIKECR